MLDESRANALLQVFFELVGGLADLIAKVKSTRVSDIFVEVSAVLKHLRKCRVSVVLVSGVHSLVKRVFILSIIKSFLL